MKNQVNRIFAPAFFAYMIVLVLSSFNPSRSLAQNIQVLIHIQPNLPPYIAQWEIDPNLTNIELSGLIQQPQTLEVQVTVEEFSRGNVLTANSVPIQVNQGPWQLHINNVDFLDWESLDYSSDFENEIGQTGRIPDGDYQICVYVRPYLDPGGTILGESCMTFYILTASPPVMIYPLAEMLVTEPTPVFQWSYGGHAPGVMYKLNIVEVLSGQHPQEAFETNPPIWSQDAILQPVYLFNDAMAILRPCTEYAIWVEVESNPGFNTASTGLYSEAIPFYWQSIGNNQISLVSPGGVCTGVVNAGTNATTVTFQWTVAGSFSSFNLVTCPNPCGTYTPDLTTTGGPGIGQPVPSEKITYSGPNHPFGLPEVTGKVQPLPSNISDAISHAGQWLNDPYYVTPGILSHEEADPCETITYTQTINFSGIIEPGAAYTWYVIGTSTDGTTVTSDTYCNRYAPITTGGGIPDNVPCPGCAIKHALRPGPPIIMSLVAPASAIDSTKEEPKVPLALLAWDNDDEIQTCLCAGQFIEKKISVVDPVTYEWTLEGNGSLETSSGPSNLYKPGDLEIGSTSSASITCKIKDYSGNDPPAFMNFEVDVKRTGLCNFASSVSSTTHSEGGPSLTATGAPPMCLPQKEEWNAMPSITATVPGEVRVGVGRRVLLRASGMDEDELKIICSGECGYAEEKIPEKDEVIYNWSATLGGFPDHGGDAMTNSWNTTVIYKAGEDTGEGEIKVKVTDTGQAGDGPLNFVMMLLVGKVDLQVEGVSEEDEDCKGGCLMVNQDDDNDNKVKDLDDKKVEKEDDLVKITLTQSSCKGDIILKAIEGADKIKVWAKMTKEEEIKLPKSYKPGDLPVTLYVEGIASSKEVGDIRLELSSTDPVHDDKVRFTAAVVDLDVNTNRDAEIDDKDDALESKEVDYFKSGALVLANLDDDAAVQKTDTSDNVITSVKDFDDFSKMIARKMVPPKDWHAQLIITDGWDYIRVFRELKKGAVAIMGYVDRATPAIVQYEIPDADLAKGDVEFFIEGIRPGKQVTLLLQLGAGEQVLDVCGDTIRMLVTPLIFHSNIRPTQRVFYSDWKVGGFQGNEKFVQVFKPEAEKIIGAGNAVGINSARAGIFCQDIFEIGYQDNPANHAGKRIKMPTVLDNPWQEHGLSNYPEQSLLKPDFGLQRGESEFTSGSELVDITGGDYGGNLEVIPPFQDKLPFGQIVIGDNMHEKLKEFLVEQKVQEKDGKTPVILPVDPDKGSMVFHVDEVFNVVPSSKDKKFKVVVGDIDLAIALLKASTAKELKPLRDKYLSTKKEDVAAIKAIRERLADVKSKLKSDGGLADADIILLPVLYPFEFKGGYGVPNAVNLQVVDSKIFIPDPIYDKEKGTAFMPMQKDISKRLGDAGVNVKDILFVNTTQMSGSGGEAHCATNAERKMPN